jgi:hypothetical protein
MRSPMGHFVRRALIRGIVSSLLLPILLSVVTGLRALLVSLGDEVGARFCGRVALVAAVVWLLAVIATSILAGLTALEASERRCRGRGGRFPRHPRRRRPRHGLHRERARAGDDPRRTAGNDLGGDERPFRRDAGES